MLKIMVLEAGGPCGMSCIKLIKNNTDCNIIGVDADQNSPAKVFCSYFETIPLANEESFSKVLSNIINKYNPDIILPCFENGFHKCQYIKGNFITDFEKAILCKNKYSFYNYCKKLDIPVIETYKLSKISTIEKNMYIKPTMGVGSRNNFIVHSTTELSGIKLYLGKNIDDYIIQPLITGIHRNIDVFMDNRGKYIISIPRKDLKQNRGNCITVHVQKNKRLEDFSKKVGEILEIKSPFNLEVFEVKKNVFIINEINVRFGGGIIFGAMSGCDLVNYLIYNDKKYINDYKNGYYSRYLEAIAI